MGEGREKFPWPTPDPEGKVPDEQIIPEDRSEQSALRELLVYENPKREEYGQLIKNEEEHVKGSAWDSRDLQTSYSEGWYRTDFWRSLFTKEKNETADYFQKKLENETLVDLGGGMMSPFAVKFGVKKYIGVNRYISEEDPVDLYKDLWADHEKPHGTEILVKADMLDFVSRLPDNSVTYAIDGIGPELFSDQGLTPYNRALANEVTRTTKPGGLVFGKSSAVFQYMDMRKFTDKTNELINDHTGEKFILEKKTGRKKPKK